MALALALISGPASAESGTMLAPERKADAVLVGSSSFNQSFGHIIARELERRGYQVTRKGVSGAGLARPDFQDMNQVLEALPVGDDTAAVFVYLGVNDAQAVWLYPHERSKLGPAAVPFGAAEWDTIYARRTREFLDRICQRGVRKAIVLLPVDVNRPDLQQRLQRIREIQARAAAETRCAVVVQTAGDAGHFEVAGSPTRLPDGFHMSERGARIVWGRIEAQVLQLLASSAAP
ncbi:MAG: GDSL-type esterase/lipase family protein [Deltaproteobacteria bacterium]